MRDLGDMIQRVRQKIGDYAGAIAPEPHIETAMQTAADEVWNAFLDHSQALHVLMRYDAADYSEATPLVAEQEEYELPGDCLRLREVQLMPNDQADAWTPLTRKDEPAEAAPRSGSNTLFGVGGGYAGRGLCWSDRAQPGFIRIWPALKSTSGERIRFRYAAKPAWPTDYGCTLNDPNGDGTKEHNLPERVTEVVEWGTVLELATDQLGLNISYEAAYTSYHRALRSMIQTSRVTKPTRQYIKRVQQR